MEDCFICGRRLDSRNSDHNAYECTNCGCLICEVCHYKFTVINKNPKEGESNCLGVDCPDCKKLLHFEEL